MNPNRITADLRGEVEVDPGRYAYRSERNVKARAETKDALRHLKATVDYVRASPLPRDLNGAGS